MRNRLNSVWIALAATLLAAGCGVREQAAAPVPEPAALPPPPEPTLTVGTGYHCDPAAPWTDLDADALEQPRDAELLAVLTNGTPVSVVHLGDRVRIYNLSGRWRPATLAWINEDEAPIRSVRLDLPPEGVVQAPLPVELAGEEGTLSMRLIEASVDDADSGGVVLLDRRIGTPAEEMTTEHVKELGFVQIERYSGADALASADDVPPGVALAAMSGDANATVTAERWSAGTSSHQTEIRLNAWEAIVTTEHYSSFSSHSGGRDGAAPPERWWADQVAEAAESIRKTEEMEAAHRATPADNQE